MSEDESDAQESTSKVVAKKEGTMDKNVPGTESIIWGDIPAGRAAVEKASEKKARSVKKWLPAIDNPFWELYANKLRVNAADSGVCNLDSIQ